MKKDDGALAGKPHFLNLFNAHGRFMAACVFPLLAAWLGQTFIGSAGGRLAVLTGGAILSAVCAAKGICTNCRTRWETDGDTLRVTMPEGERRLKLRGMTCAEWSGTRLFGCAKVKLYCEGRRRAWFSMIMKKEQADALIRRVMESPAPVDACPSGSFRQGRHSAAAFALTAERPLLLLTASALLTVFSRGSLPADIGADALLLAAVAAMLRMAVKYSRLTTETLPGGYRVTYGRRGGRMVYVPYRSAAGVSVGCGPAAAFCGACSMELICSGGRRVPCTLWMPRGNREDSPLRLLGLSVENGRNYADAGRLRRAFFREFMVCLCVSAACVVTAVSGGGNAMGILCAGAIFALCCGGMRCWLGIRMAGEFGAQITPSAVRTGGMAFCRAELLYLRRGSVDGMRISSSLSCRMDDLCSIMPVAGGKSVGVWCRCVPYSAVSGMTARFV